MIYEFALDPAAVSSWASFRYFYDQFGVSHGRLIAKLPSNWDSIVRNAIGPQCRDVERASIIARLIKFSQKAWPIDREYVEGKDWFETAVTSHMKEPFRAIVAQNIPKRLPFCLRADDIDEENPLWRVPRTVPVKRCRDQLVLHAKALLRVSREIRIIDRYYDPDNPDYDAVVDLINEALKGKRPSFIEVHCEAKYDIRFFIEYLERRVLPMLDRDAPLTDIRFIRWKRGSAGGKQHARYVVTDFGGIYFDFGFQNDKSRSTCDVGLLETDHAAMRFAEYGPEAPRFDFGDGVQIRGGDIPQVRLDALRGEFVQKE